MSDYTAKHVGPAFDPRKIGTNARLAPLVTAIKTCPDCGRPTLITHTTDLRPPYDKVGCFHCGHGQPTVADKLNITGPT